ncbi:MAG: hypothetical protein F7C09_02875, partial [Aeropyrum sp.]|nr:hypothetical protein [Aeropyrum sp.]
EPRRVYRELPVILGKTSLLGVVERVLRELDVGERKEVEVTPEEGFGERREDLVIRVPIKRLRRMNIPVRVGAEVDVGGRTGRIARVTERFAYIDFNHPLAGKRLKVEVEVVGKLEGDAERAKYLAARILAIDPAKVEADEGEGVLRIILPVEVLGLNDLEALLAKLATDVMEYLSPKRLEIVIRVEYPRGSEGEGKEESSEESSEGGEEESGEASQE